MSFASPIWLLGLLPWAAVAVWLLLGRRPRVRVPFLPFWKDDAPPPPRKKKGVIVPPLAVLAAMAAMLLALLGAAGPRLGYGEHDAGEITIIVDRGITLSARGERLPRYREIAALARQPIAEAFGAHARVRLLSVPGDEVVRTDVDGWARHVDQFSLTAVDTRSLLSATVAQELAGGAGRVIVITDHLPVADERVVCIGPARAIENVGIVHIAARLGPPAEVMVRLRNESPRESAAIRIDSGQVTITKQIELPPSGQERDYFVAMPALADTVAVEIAPHDAREADDRAFLARHGLWPRLEARTPLPEELSWMMQVYSRQHPPADDSARIAVSAGGQGVSAMERAAIVGPATRPATRPTGELVIAIHPVTASVNWRQVVASASLGEAPAGSGWEPVASAGGRVLVAVRADPAWQVWVALYGEGWASTRDYVIFWQNVFEWLGEGGEQFSSQPVGRLAPDWILTNPPADVASGGLWPGIYEKRDATSGAITRCAANAPPASVSTSIPADWRGQLKRISPGRARGAPADRAFLTAAVAAVGLAAATWPRTKRQAPPAPAQP